MMWKNLFFLEHGIYEYAIVYALNNNISGKSYTSDL